MLRRIADADATNHNFQHKGKPAHHLARQPEMAAWLFYFSVSC